MQDITYRSRIDTWLISVTLISVISILLHAFMIYRENPPLAWFDAGLLGMLFLVGRLVGYPCVYILTANRLIIRAGVIRQVIPYADITDVQLSRSLWSAPALSLQRVKISFAGRFQLVSPQNREQFIRDLSERITLSKTTNNL